MSMIFAIFINPDSFPYVFSFTYFTSIIIAFVYALIAGRKLTARSQQWTLTVGCTFLSLILFSKLGSIPFIQWWSFISGNTNNTCQHKTILGGLIGAVVVFLLLRKYFELSWKTIDVFALVLPLCAALQRIGCLLSGCCFGNVTHGSFSFQYSVGSAAYLSQLEHGLISSDDLMSLPVIPLQFYNILGCVFIGIMVFLFSKKLKANGNKFLLSLMLYFVLRFVLDFFKDSSANFIGGDCFLGLKVVQWFLLIICILLFGIIYFREKKQPAYILTVANPNLQPTIIAGFVLLCSTIWLFPKCDTLEKITILAINIPTLFAVSTIIYSHIKQHKLIWHMALMFPFCALQMSQVELQSDSTSKIVTHKISAGGMINAYEEMYRSDCSSNSYKYTTTAYHIKYDYTNGKNNNDNFLAGMGAAVGKYQFLYEYPLYNKTHTLYGLQPYVGYSNNFINGKVGFIAGNINYADTNKINHLQFSNELELFLHNFSLWQQYCPTTAMLGPPQFSAGIGWRDGKQKSKDFLLALRLGYTKVNKHDALCGWVSCTSNQKYDLSLYGNIHSNRIQGLSTSNLHFGVQLGYKW